MEDTSPWAGVWDQALDLVSRFVTPVRDTLLQYLPLLLIGLLLLTVPGKDKILGVTIVGVRKHHVVDEVGAAVMRLNVRDDLVADVLVGTVRELRVDLGEMAVLLEP